VTIARAQGHATYPARFQLIAAMNPCRCGHFAELACARAPRCAEDYQARLSGPLLDRIDLHIDVPAVSPGDLALPPAAEGSAAVAAGSPPPARGRRRGMPGFRCSAASALTPRRTGSARRDRNPGRGRPRAADPCRRAVAFIRAGYHRVLRVARTLADLEGSPNVARRHVAEALSYRRVAVHAENAP